MVVCLPGILEKGCRHVTENFLSVIAMCRRATETYFFIVVMLVQFGIISVRLTSINTPFRYLAACKSSMKFYFSRTHSCSTEEQWPVTCSRVTYFLYYRD